jgi:hypothetical protein
MIGTVIALQNTFAVEACVTMLPVPSVIVVITGWME